MYRVVASVGRGGEGLRKIDRDRAAASTAQAGRQWVGGGGGGRPVGNYTQNTSALKRRVRSEVQLSHTPLHMFHLCFLTLCLSVFCFDVCFVCCGCLAGTSSGSALQGESAMEVERDNAVNPREEAPLPATGVE